jgi:AcrR family transcriptional regulator
VTQPTRSQRQWQLERTAAAIEQAALRVFLERGYEGTTAEQIATAAGISTRTFFRYFPHGKGDVMILEARRPMLALAEQVAARPSEESPLTAVRRAWSELLANDPGLGPNDAAVIYGQIAIDHPDLLARMIGERQLVMESLVPSLAARIGVDASADPRPRLLAYSIHAAGTTAWLTWLERPATNYPQLLDELLCALELVFDPVEDLS